MRIDEVPEADDDDEEAFLGRTSFVKPSKTPVNIGDHLSKDDDNMLHFKALAKYYGLNREGSMGSDIVNMPDSVLQANQRKFVVRTPEAQV